MQERLVLEDPLLGSPLATYSYSNRSPLIVPLLSIAFFGFLVWQSTQQTPVDTQGVLIFSGFVLLSLVTIVVDLLFNEQRIVLFENGMRAYYLTHTQVIFWQDVETVLSKEQGYGVIVHISIKNKKNSSKTYKYYGTVWGSLQSAIELIPGKMLRVGKAEILLRALDGSIKHRFEKALHRYDAGERIDFGEFQLSRDGIHVKNEILFWNEVYNIYTDGWIILIEKIGSEQPWRELPITEIPNEDLVIPIIAQYKSTWYRAPEKGTELF